MKKIIASLVLSILLAGCGGGGKGPITPPSPPPSNPGNSSNGITEEIPTRAIAPSEVRSGETVDIELTTDDPQKDKLLAQTTINWNVQPRSPALNLEKLQNSRFWRIKFPTVDIPTIFSFSFTAVNSQQNLRFVGQFQIRVVPVVRPRVYISYPTGANNDTIVASGVKLQVFGSISPGSSPVARIEVVVDGRIVYTINNPGYDFQFDLEEFGAAGTKQLIIRAVDSAGNTGETSIEIRNDPTLLNQLAREFLLQYSTAGGRVERFGDLTDGPYTRPVYVELHRGVEPYRSIVEAACRFWTRYTGIQFVVLSPEQKPPSEKPLIIICDRFDEDPRAAADAVRGYYDSFKIDVGVIRLYRGWLDLSENLKALVIAHELAHILVIPDSRAGHTQNGSFMDGGATVWYFHPYMQEAVRILYSKNPGESL